MSHSHSDDSGEDFASIPSSGDEGDESDIGTEFQALPQNWTREQKKVLMHRVDDWKASKYPKARKLVLQGAMKDLANLDISPEAEGLKIVCSICCVLLVTNVH